MYEAVFHNCAEHCGAHIASAEYRNPIFAEAGWHSHPPFQCQDSLVHLDSLGEKGGSAGLLSNWTTQTQGTSTSKAHVAGLVTERPGVIILSRWIYTCVKALHNAPLTYPVLHIQPGQVSVLEIRTTERF